MIPGFVPFPFLSSASLGSGGRGKADETGAVQSRDREETAAGETHRFGKGNTTPYPALLTQTVFNKQALILKPRPLLSGPQ